MTSRLCQGFCCSAQDHKSRGSLFTRASTVPTTGTEKTTDKLSRYLRAAPMGKTLGEGRSFALGRVPARIEHLVWFRDPSALQEQIPAQTGDRDAASHGATPARTTQTCWQREARPRIVKNVEMQSQQVCPKEGTAGPGLGGCSGTRTACRSTRGSATSSEAGGQTELGEPQHAQIQGVSLGDKPCRASDPPLSKRNHFAAAQKSANLNYSSNLLPMRTKSQKAKSKSVPSCPQGDLRWTPRGHPPPPATGGATR